MARDRVEISSDRGTVKGPKCSRRREAILVAIMLAVLGVTAGIIGWVVGKDTDKDHGKSTTWVKKWPRSSGNATLTKDLTFEIWKSSQLKFKGLLDYQNTVNGTITDCSKAESVDICLQWPDRKLTINYTKYVVYDLPCYDVEWFALHCVEQVLTDCIVWGGAHWYGGYQDNYQPWPLDDINRTLTAYVANDSYVREIGGVLERYFFNTNGTSVFVDNDVPLYISINSPAGLMCLVAQYKSYPYLNVNKKLPKLKYTVCQASNVKEIHQKTSAIFIAKPVAIPDPRLFQDPVWSTWAQYHKNINQSMVLEFAQDILRYNFSHAQLEIDDEWTPKYGDMEFNIAKFPNATQMLSELNDLGFRVTLWVHPFFNIDSKTFLDAAANRFLIRGYDSPRPALVSWWDGELAGILDVSNSSAVDWFLGKLEALKRKYKITSFKFDAGEIKWLPNIYSVAINQNNPNNIYPKQWVSLATRADHTVRHQEVRVGYKTQSAPIFVRMMDKFSRWDHTNGIKSLIPSALTFGILGYPFVLPDMIGGNAYNNLPDPELFIRWLQVNTFLPSMQFSIVPWQYNETVVDIARTFTNLHSRYSKKLTELAKDAVLTGYPIIRPLWWISPGDPEAWICETEYLVGDDLLVAPVLEQGARQRDIYLPDGTWHDHVRGGTLEGGKWHRNYRADMDELPYFQKVH